jgi:alcohol dehydrogenase, propanol-preferring
MRLVSEGKPLERSITNELPRPAKGEALVRIDYSGVCHTDLHLIEGSYNLGNGKKIPTGLHLPVTLGHEISGTVEEIPPENGLRKGDRVIVYPWIGCGSCRKCVAGLENLCEGKPRFLGVFLDGGYSDYVLVPDARYLVNAGQIDPKQAAPLACSGLTAFSSVKKCNLGQDDTLFVVGAGGLGTIAVQIAKKIFGARVVMADIDDDKLELARKLGADFVINTAKMQEKEIVADLRAITPGGRGADAAIDFVGIRATCSLGFRVIGKGGTLVVVGLAGGIIELPLALFPLRGVQIIGNFTGTLNDLVELVDISKEGLVSPVISEVCPLEDANIALDKLNRGEVKGRILLRT